MNVTLVVVRPFGPHAVGDLVTAPDEVAAILASEHASNIVRVPPPNTRTES